MTTCSASAEWERCIARDDPRLGRSVAIKVLPSHLTSDPERLDRFEREARLLASLNHPSIAAIYGVEEFSGGRALVMELVEGEDLAQRIARGPIPLAERCRSPSRSPRRSKPRMNRGSFTEI